jgi:hypothetical protein
MPPSKRLFIFRKSSKMKYKKFFLLYSNWAMAGCGDLAHHRSGPKVLFTIWDFCPT